MIALKALAHSELEQLKYFSYNPPLKYKGSIGCRSLSKRSKKYLSFSSEA